MPRETVVSRWCERVAEATWLLALTLIPLFFNLYSARHFEPDKAAVLRSLALVAITAVFIRSLDRLIARSGPSPSAGSPQTTANTGPPFWRRFSAIPLALPSLLYALVFLFTTFTSVVPSTSFWGSYQRLQGTYSNLSYMLIFVTILAVVRRREQLERMVTIIMATSVAVAGYGLLQHFGNDPLPWLGDVITRVASTMGNSIFVAAYMIMVVPLALYRLIAGLSAVRAAPKAERPVNEWLWALCRGLIFGAGLSLLLAMLKFGAVIRTVDYRYWWVLLGAIACTTAIWWLLTVSYATGERRIPIWPGLLTLGYLLMFGLQFATSAGGGVQEILSGGTATRAQDWWLWLFFSVAALAAAYGMALALPRRPARPVGLGLLIDALAAGLVALLLLIVVFFTQSRGPWMGIFAGLFIFVTLTLWQATRQASSHANVRLSRLLRTLLVGWVAVAVLGGGFLISFNLSNAPFFEQLRNVPYLGRMGRLLEVNEGTGLVRRLIWTGDEHAGGAVALITSDPLRTVIGWGPESMFVAFNKFYPPALANIEARGASPDRSHEALLDELVTKGVLGLASYLFLLLSFVALSWRLIRTSQEWAWKVFFIACLSAVVCTFVEGLTGIPIVSTLMMLWVTLGMTVAGGAVAGHYRLSLAPVATSPDPSQDATAASPVPPVPATATAGQRRKAPRNQAARSAVARGSRATPRGGARQRTTPSALLAYGLVAGMALLGVLLFNVNPIRADMRFQQGQSLAQRDSTSSQALVRTLDEYLQTVRLSPREDFYYLNLGRVLMSLAESMRAQGGPLGEPVANASVEDLINLRDEAVLASWLKARSPNAVMSYAQAVLLRAHELNPLNKDHFANLGRVNSYWYRWSNDPARLRTAADWYEQVTAIAPQDVTLLNERTGVLMTLGEYTVSKGDQAQADSYFAQARTLLEHSRDLDPNYPDTYARLGELTRTSTKDLDAATGFYVQAIEHDSQSLNNSIESIANTLAGRPDLLLKLRESYAVSAAKQEQRLAELAQSPNNGSDSEAVRKQIALLNTITGLLAVRGGDVNSSVEPYRRAAALQPANATYSRNYSIVLSDTKHYSDAISETERLISLLRQQPGSEQTITDSLRLIALFKQVSGGQ